MKVKVIKIGGAVLSDPQATNVFLQGFLKEKGAKILVHGGGNTATQWAHKMGLSPKMIEGRRITDKPMLEVVTMIFSGLNKQLTAQLQHKKCPALGICGADQGIIQSHKREVDEFDYGYVGDISEVKIAPFKKWLTQGVTPVVSPLTCERATGYLLNTNADTVASALASALTKVAKVELVYCFDKKGVLTNPEDPQSLMSHFSTGEYEQLKAAGILQNGILPKVENSINALKKGVEKVRITHYKYLNKGTLIEKGE